MNSKVNVGGIWKKNEMKKQLKINLPLEDQSSMLGVNLGMLLLVGDECVFDEISSGFSLV